MSLTLTPVRNGEDKWGRTSTTLFDITLDSSYPLVAGYVINAQDVGLKNLLSAQVQGGNKAAGAVLPVFDFGTPAGIPATSGILRLFLPTGGGSAPATLTAPVGGTAGAITIAGTATGTIAPGGTTVTGASATPAVSVPAAGLTASQATGGALVAGIGKEVGNTTDVSSITIRVRFFGF